jgi:hypothetical protein
MMRQFSSAPLLILLTLFTWGVPSLADAQFLGLTEEVITESEYGVTYRVYAAFDSPGDFVSAVYATESIYDNPPLLISTTTSFYQSQYATGIYASGVNPGFFIVFDDLQYDSWLTIGGGPGQNSGTQDIGLNAEFASFASGGNINTTGSSAGGSWFSTITPPFTAGAEGLVLLAQLTTDGVVDISLNLQWKNSVGESSEVIGATLTLGAPVASGCTNPAACNFDESAQTDDGSCLVPGPCDQCLGSSSDGSGTIMNGDIDGDGVCDEDEIDGCTDAAACNFDASATDNDGSCLIPNVGLCEACDGETITILDADGDGVCDSAEISGCKDASACNYDATPTTDTDNTVCTYPTGCESCSGETNGTGVVLSNDDDDDGICNGDEIPGCINPIACNFNENATDGDDSCLFATSPCDSCSGENDGTGTVLTNDDDGDGVCNSDEVAGCMSATACNFNPQATDENGSCVFANGNCEVCQGDGGVAVLDADGDGICDNDEISGCQDVSACNYNENATDDGGNCVYANLNCAICSGPIDGTGVVVVLDADGDNICDADEIPGCQDESACNYNANATDSDDSCLFPLGNCESCSGENDGSGVILANDDDGDGICNADEIQGCQAPSACNYNESATDSDGNCDYPEGCETCSGEIDGTGQVIANDDDQDGICNADEIAGCQDPLACNFNINATDDADNCQFATGCAFCSGATDGSGYVLAGDSDSDGICDADEIAGCSYPSACNFDELATDDDGSCVYPDLASCQTCLNQSITFSDADNDGICDFDEIPGCTDPAATNYNCFATDATDSCIYPDPEVNGCTYPWAPNFNPEASIDDGTCVLPPCEDDDNDGVCDADEIYGCADNTACNYSASATENFGCIYAETGLDCNGACLADADQDGICDNNEVLGCLDPYALNFSPEATDEDGTCSYEPDPVAGCTYATACNFDESANLDDGSCDFGCYGCTDSAAMNYDLTATIDDGSCLFAEEETFGCTYPNACNYNSAATTDNGSCDYSCFGCTDESADNFDSAATQNDGSCVFTAAPILGCTYADACNFDSEATLDDGSCDYSCFGCTDESADNFDPAATQDDGSCVFTEAPVLGCTYADACNFNEVATQDDGTCNYNCYGCTEENAANYNPAAIIDDGSCVSCTTNDVTCAGDLDNDNIVGTADLLIFLSVFGFPCN